MDKVLLCLAVFLHVLHHDLVAPIFSEFKAIFRVRNFHDGLLGLINLRLNLFPFVNVVRSIKPVLKVLLTLAKSIVECMDVLYMASQCKGEEILHALFVMESAALVQNHVQSLEALEVDARVVRLKRLDSALQSSS